ncbi:MAG: MOSC domain-containing protein, partial [Solirubrobacteraceae bacterium]|nr:MOSC domain-containing protein [Solirubrobacteraceae bacterium]
MRVAEVWRFPVKSLQGERLEAAEITPDGIAGDRGWAIFDQQTGLGLTGRREPALLFAGARLTPRGGVEITLPDGSRADDDAALSAWLGRPVTLRSVAGEGERAYENPDDPEHEDTSPWRRFMGPQTGPFHDSARLSLVSTATLGAWDRR